MLSFNRFDDPHKPLISFANFMVWASSAIVVGITGHFLKDFDRDQHLTFEMVISAFTLALWLPSFIAPFLKSYKFYYAFPNLVLSYLWLTAFIFAAQDYNESECVLNAPTGGKCALKKTSEAFIFLAL
ncbi:hypothetical protein K458DRAFT_321616 [Lentithecium fluviatile CBS 122367]|uniref:MARVEL domain-containing protein n=1 Tax=Lentithecium fluviatile CBS 122367 TaxID=1168545 RepID=A0A6G1IFG1_9PLEO|nr:hypothetical protein K458DRAFT_321616 [Lentithecium fluviatile CBS 122367]